MKPVYIIDYAVVDTLGSSIESNYLNMRSLAKGPRQITRYDTSLFPNILCTKAYEIDYYDGTNLMPRLLNDVSTLLSSKHKFPKDTAVMFGAFTTSGGYAIKDDFENSMRSGMTRFSPIKLFANNSDLLSATLARKLQLEGLTSSLNAACSSSMFNLHYAFTCIQLGIVKSALVGNLESPVHPAAQYYWQSTSAISTKNGGSCKPFDKSRDGFIQAEGASLYWICDEDTVKELGLTPKAEILSVVAAAKGYGTATMTAHDRTGEHQISCINQALQQANKTVKDISHFNAHATSTPVGDDIEFDVFKKVWNDIDIACVSFKGYIGHAMSACGLLEMAYSLEAQKNKFIQPNFDLTDPLSDDPRLITEPKPLTTDTFIKASFGFGGRTVIAVVNSLV